MHHFIGLLLVAVQIACAVHVIRTGRPYFWLFLIIFVPLIGCLVYFFTQILPDLGQASAISRAGNSLVKAIDPQRELRRRKEQLELADTVQNRVRLADECVEAGMVDEAIALYERSLVGPQQDDPDIMLKLADARFRSGRPDEARQLIERVEAAHPGYGSHGAQLLYARTLEASGALQEAARVYDEVMASFPGEEARVRFALMLKKMGETERAAALFQETLVRAKQAPRYYRVKEKEWIALAKNN